MLRLPQAGAAQPTEFERIEFFFLSEVQREM
jgi:hypothetical protein